MGMGGQHHTLADLPLGKGLGAHCTGGSVGFIASLEEYGNVTHNGIRTPDRPVFNEPLYRIFT